MRKSSIALALGVCALTMLAVAVPAQKKKTTKPAPKKSTSSVNMAETGLAGIKLFDSGTRLVSIYGSPDEIQAVTLGGGSAGPGSAGGAGGRGLPGGGGPPGAPTSAGGPSVGFTLPGDFSFGDDVLDRQGIPGDPVLNRQGGPGKFAPGGGAGPIGAPGAGGGAGGGGNGGPGGAMGSTGDRVVYTRWVYNRNASKYGFILDKYNRVVQCEAVGIQAGKARTRRGITFGSSFASIIKKYGAPDGYEMAGNNIVVRYLSKAKCAFRLSKLGENKPDVVTGIVVAAGKR